MCRLELPARLDVLAAEELAEALEHLRDSPLELVAAGVTHLGGLCLQVLMAARLQWMRDGLTFRLVDVSDAMRDGCTRLGLAPDFFEEGEDDAACAGG